MNKLIQLSKVESIEFECEKRPIQRFPSHHVICISYMKQTSLCLDADLLLADRERFHRADRGL